MTHFRHAMIVAALLASASTASAQTTVITREPVDAQTVVTTEPLELTRVSEKDEDEEEAEEESGNGDLA